MIDEVAEHLPQTHDLWYAIHEREHDRAESGLHLRVLVEPIQHDVGNRIALQLDHDAHSITVRLVTKIPNFSDFLVPHELGDLLDQARLVHHERDCGDDDAIT